MGSALMALVMLQLGLLQALLPGCWWLGWGCSPP